MFNIYNIICCFVRMVYQFKSKNNNVKIIVIYRSFCIVQSLRTVKSVSPFSVTNKLSIICMLKQLQLSLYELFNNTYIEKNLSVNTKK